MLQAYYDGDELIIHKTELFDFTKEKDTAALLISADGQVHLQWVIQHQKRSQK